MKPRPVENGYLAKAIELEQRLDAIEKAKCDCGKEPCECKNCPKCGSKMNKMGGCMKMDCGGKMDSRQTQLPDFDPAMKKAEPGFKAEKITDINPSFHAESGGQTKTGYFTTNGRTIETEDAPKKKKPKEATNMEQLGSRMNPHEGSGVEREDSAGDSKPLKKGVKAQMRESGAPVICGSCGATESTGCKGPFPGVDIFACEAFKPLR
jgi:hypothetical protein